MKRIFSIISLLLLLISAGYAADNVSSSLPEGAVTGVSIERAESVIIVKMQVNPSLFPAKANREIWISPVIASGDNSKTLTPVLIAGRTRYFQHLRAERKNQGYFMLKAGDRKSFDYSVDVPLEAWMMKGDLKLVSQADGCCGYALAEPSEMNAGNFDFREKILEPVYVYVKPMEEIEKTRAVKGEAYVDFPVNKATILPDYRRNPQELAKIKATVEKIKNNKDMTITSLTIKGYASPEGPYALNERLARERTEALVKYVADLYAFPKNVLHADWEAEDWAGLATLVRKSDLANKNEILAVVTNNDVTPDERDAALRARFPEQYSYMLEEIYPALRHTDYNISYVIRNYTDVAEIAAIMQTAPQQLSLDELFLYANSLDKSSAEFREVMEVAVRLFPADPIANLNAATTAIDHGEYAKAREYLKKAGNSPEADYAAGLLEAKEGNYAAAKPLLEKAANQGMKDAAALLDQMRDWGWIE